MLHYMESRNILFGLGSHRVPFCYLFYLLYINDLPHVMDHLSGIFAEYTFTIAKRNTQKKLNTVYKTCHYYHRFRDSRIFYKSSAKLENLYSSFNLPSFMPSERLIQKHDIIFWGNSFETTRNF